MRQERNLDSNRHKPAKIQRPAKKKASRPNSTKTNRQIGKNKTKSVSVTLQNIKKQEKIFVGIDLHKVFLQVVNNDRELLHNKRIENNPKSIKTEFYSYPKNAKYVVESS